MAAGDLLVSWPAAAGVPPTTRYATFDTFVDGSTPTQEWLVLEFDPGATTEFADFSAYMPGQYDGSAALEVVLIWTSPSTTATDSVKWDVAFKSMTPGTDDFDSKAFDGIQSTTSDTNDEPHIATATVIDFTNAEADGVQPNDYFTVRVERDSADAGDDMDSDDAELHSVAVRINS